VLVSTFSLGGIICGGGVSSEVHLIEQLPLSCLSVYLYMSSEVMAVCFSVTTSREQLKKLSVLPTQVLKEHPCLSYWSVFFFFEWHHFICAFNIIIKIIQQTHSPKDMLKN